MLRAIPLGGLGRIGGNMMVYETADDLIVVDCGILFPTAEQPGIDYIIPDASYLFERKDKLRAYLITHAHEDHIGALPHILPSAPAPVYGTKFTLGLIEVKLADFPTVRPEMIEIRDGEPFRVGGFQVTPIPVTHSIPGSVALALDTPVGTLLHTGDFKLDPDPLDGRLTDEAALRALGDRGLLALFSDSTNAPREGHTWSEREVEVRLRELILEARNRVVLTTFSSHLHRIQTIIDASYAAGRTVIPVGRSVVQNIQMALERGFLRAPHGSLADPTYYDSLPRSHVTVIASGSQGEAASTMTRIAAGQHAIRLDPDDLVIFSSRRIPGNELAVGAVVNNLYRLGVEVIDDHREKVHTSGHAFAGELTRMLELTRPRYFVPIHGEYRHLVTHARLAAHAGVAPHDIFVVEDGNPLELERAGGEVRVRRGEPVTAGHVFVDGKGVGDVGEIVLRDRRVLAETGMVLCVAIFDEHGALVAGPDIVTRGVVHVDANQELIARASAEVERAVSQLGRRADTAQRTEEIRLTLRRFFRRELDRRPLILPLVVVL